MSTCYRVIYQTFKSNSPEEILQEEMIIESEITAPTNCLDFTMGMELQLQAVKGIQDHVLNEKLKLHSENQDNQCPKCPGKLVKSGKQVSPFHDVFSDHKVTMQRFKCNSCGHEPASTAKLLLGTIQSGELQKIQSQLGATHSFRESEELLELFSGSKRRINNHDRVKQITESVGQSLEKMTQAERDICAAPNAENIIVSVDGGHIKTTQSDSRSMEAMTAVVYRPESIVPNGKNTRNHLSSKNCAASVQDDSQEQLITGTIVAALKQGMSKTTHVTALCDGAKNCWSVIDALKPLCGSVTCILDWFHIAMKMQNISLPESLKNKFMRVKWHLWRGNAAHALKRLSELEKEAKTGQNIDKIKKFHTYISNNSSRIINYRERQKLGKVFTSNLAESTVESLINQRCKGQQHMRWSRDGLNPLLQLRAALNSTGEWQNKWRTAILNAN